MHWPVNFTLFHFSKTSAGENWPTNLGIRETKIRFSLRNVRKCMKICLKIKYPYVVQNIITLQRTSANVTLPNVK